MNASGDPDQPAARQGPGQSRDRVKERGHVLVERQEERARGRQGPGKCHADHVVGVDTGPAEAEDVGQGEQRDEGDGQQQDPAP